MGFSLRFKLVAALLWSLPLRRWPWMGQQGPSEGLKVLPDRDG